MPKLLNATAVDRLTLPSSTDTDPAWVEVKTELQLRDVIAISDEGTDAERAVTMLARLITAWNFTDQDGNPAEPTADNISKLSIEDFMYLSEWVGSHIQQHTKGLDNAEKKTLSSPLTAEVPTEPTSPPTI